MRKSGAKTVTDVKARAGVSPEDLAVRTSLGAEKLSDGFGAPVRSREALDQLFSATYEELRRLASAVRRGDPSATLSPTALVNEAWLKLAKSPEIGATSRLHFKRIAARAMRQLLVEAARRRNADKRGGGAEVTVLFDDAVKKSPSGGDELLALDHALETLAEMNPRQAVMVESRFFGGFDIPETATMLEVSEATVLRDWRAAKAWLANELRKAK
jgi:RNA polymerase sigma factor (TIGR02999 family)